ncbi:hypothetical protein LINGRAPRIM_LOCUS1271, partial [Linum grandiflorum]
MPDQRDRLVAFLPRLERFTGLIPMAAGVGKFFPQALHVYIVYSRPVGPQQSPVPLCSRPALPVLVVQREDECRYCHSWFRRCTDGRLG